MTPEAARTAGAEALAAQTADSARKNRAAIRLGITIAALIPKK